VLLCVCIAEVATHSTRETPGARLGKINKADYTFILPDKHKITCPEDKSFNSYEFFECADPGHIEIRDDVKAAAPRVALSSPPRATLSTRANSPNPSNSDATGLHYFTTGDDITLQNTQSRYQAARDHSRTNPSDPRTISAMTWSLEQKRYGYHAKRARNVHEKMYWLSRSVQAEYHARGRYQAGTDSESYIGMALLNWRTNLRDG
jgi:hypothetical protein